MIETLIDSPLLLAGSIAVASVLNYLVGLSMLREQNRQEFVEREYWRPPGIAGKARSGEAQLAWSFASSAIVIVLTFFMERFERELLSGGFFVMVLGTLGSNAGDLLAVRALRQSEAAEGRIRYSAVYGFKARAARFVGLSIITGAVAVLFNSKPFLVGAVLFGATAVGWHRRARQASRAKGRSDTPLQPASGSDAVS